MGITVHFVSDTWGVLPASPCQAGSSHSGPMATLRCPTITTMATLVGMHHHTLGVEECLSGEAGVDPSLPHLQCLRWSQVLLLQLLLPHKWQYPPPQLLSKLLLQSRREGTQLCSAMIRAS